jgi:nucleoside-diphosphate-sugar epimerase
MKVLVTGATGFVGRHVIRSLSRTGCDVVATAIESELPQELGALPVTYVPCDLSSQTDNYFDHFGRPDAMIHLAWQGLPNYKDLFHLEENLPNNYFFIKNMIEHGLKDLTAIGTCLEYGMKNGELSEDIPADPQVPYAISKDMLRRSIEQLRSVYTFTFKWVRIFYLHGDGQNRSSLIEQLKAALDRGDKSFKMSRGEQLRDYLPVEVAASHIVSIAMQRRVNGIINCCSGTPISIRRLVEEYLERDGRQIQLDLGYYQYPDYEPMAFWGDSTRLSQILRQPGRD